ncbi:MAG: hypothetical protein ABR585_11870 [Gemmatimonadaceae bacterium]
MAVVIAILGLAGAIIGATLLRQQRFYRGATELLHARADVRDALDLLATDIRGLSPTDTVSLMADSAIEFFAAIGSSVIAAKETPDMVHLPAGTSPHGNTLTAFLTQPDTGDLAILYRKSEIERSPWERYRIVAFSAAAGSGGYALTLARPLASDIDVGAPIRFVRRGRYSLYRSSDGAWYLGYRRCNALSISSCGAIQPISGPYRAYSAVPAASGILLEYYDTAGVRLGQTSSPLTLARVDVTARSESRQRILFDGRSKGFADSARVSIAVRNRLE